MSNPIRAIAFLGLCMLAGMSWFAPRGVEAQAEAGPSSEFQNLAAAMAVEPGVTCLESEKLLEHVSSWLGTDRVSAPLAIEVRGSPHFTRTVWFRISRGDAALAERRFEPAPERCDDLHAAVGLAIALALKASLLDSVIGARVGEAHESRPYRFDAQALGGLAVIPGFDFGVGLSLQRSVAERFAARLSVLGLLGPFGAFRDDEGRFKTWLALARLDVCSRLLELGSMAVSVCVGIAAGGLYATGEAFPMSRSGLVSYVAVANALEVEIALSARWSISLGVDVLVPLRRSGFVVRDSDGAVITSHEASAAGGLIALGPSYRF